MRANAESAARFAAQAIQHLTYDDSMSAVSAISFLEQALVAARHALEAREARIRESTRDPTKGTP